MVNQDVSDRTVGYVATLVAIVVIIGLVTFAWTSIQKYEREVQINAQTAIEQTRIEEAAKVERAKEHLKWVPWN